MTSKKKQQEQEEQRIKLQKEFEMLTGRPTKETDIRRLTQKVEKARESANPQQGQQLTPEQMNEKTMEYMDTIAIEMGKPKPGDPNAPVAALVVFQTQQGYSVTYSQHTPIVLAKAMAIQGYEQVNITQTSAIVQQILAQLSQGQSDAQPQLPPGSKPPEAPEQPESEDVSAKDPKEGTEEE